ncbi:pirin family protein [Hwangdonia lutea]|uniref:Pirin family protein n=1 Tax=Hwangdonia lutea TaxID=3075823 RepID=A0AA97HR46_9FLAO|nr:pirin family protein [Hwangdonia sp. SCSIO 19198]WOD44596.1 pirin family protein [Hwangdonia sp. SCSIO 19198]
MSNIKLIIEERATNIGKFMVGRLLPFRQKRMVGPFIYIDHMGPVKLNERENFDVLPHPHIGLSTLTFLFEGSIMHRDTLGNEIEIKPGAVNWMTAGKGIVHSERTPDYLRDSPLYMHGLQIWVALPKNLEQMEPQFSHIEEKQIPSWTEGDLQFKLVAGEAFGRKSPVPVFSKLFMLEIKSKTKQVVNIGHELYGEAGLYILKGAIESEGNIYEPKQLLVAKDSTLCEFTIKENSTIYIFGGEPFPEERYIDWNFVSSSKALIEEAKEKWKAKEFPKIEGDESEYIPYPTFNRK